MNWVEIVGYIGSGLVLISMLMRSVFKLRIINLAGSIIFSVYALIIKSYPTAVMNICLALINIYYLIRMSKPTRHFSVYEDKPGSAWVNWLLEHYKEDIAQYFPDFRADHADGNTRVFVVLQESEAAGLLIGTPDENGDLDLKLDYATPVYRDCSVGTALYAALPEHGVRSITWRTNPEAHLSYLQKMGFEKLDDGSMQKKL